jgi:sortase A
VSALALPRKRRRSRPRLNRRGKTLWTAGNLLMLVGIYLLLYVGGLFADEQYNIIAAEGGSDVALEEGFVPSPVIAQAPSGESAVVGPRPVAPVQPAPIPTAAPSTYILPRLNDAGSGVELNTLVPKAVGNFGPSTVSRILIPRINVDKKVIEVGWTLQDVSGQQVAVWEVAKYTVGHHTGSANPGQRGNMVFAGHSGGRAYPFNDLFYLEPGDQIVVWSNGQQYDYSVQEKIVVDEVGPNVTAEQRQQNARYIEPTEDEIMTLVTCWPLSGPNKFAQRVIIRAKPDRPAPPSLSEAPANFDEGWIAR